MDNSSHIKIAQLRFPDIKLKASELHKARGYFGREFKEFDLLHNHDKTTGKVIYRYPAIQFKITDKCFSLFAYGEKAIEIFKTIFFKSDRMQIDGQEIPVVEKQFEIKSESIGISKDAIEYEFISPWIGLNQENYTDYKGLNSIQEKNEKLNSIIINNIISFSKFSGYTVPDRIKAESRLKAVPVNLKGITHTGFIGRFRVNFLLPDYIGLGKSSSRGYGCVKKIRKVEQVSGRL